MLPQSRTPVTLVVDSRCTHGEGTVWSEQSSCLYWTDIGEQRIFQYCPATQTTKRWPLPDSAGCLGLIDAGRLLVVMRKAIAIAHLNTSRAGQLDLTVIEHFEHHQPYTHSNDGRADRHGHFVFGTMDTHSAKESRGQIYQFSMRHGLRTLALPRVSIPNSICFSPDGGTMYFCDSVTPQIFACDYDPEHARTGRPRLFATLDQTDAEPDGSIIDAEGYLWNAQWRAWRIVRYSPRGKVDHIIPMPIKNPTCPAFGGPQLQTLFVISSRMDHSPDELDQSPQAGGLFAIETGISGLPESPIEMA